MAVKPPSGIDDQAFFRLMASEDALGVVVRGVIYVEHELIALAEENAVNPEALKRMGLDYSGRVAYCISIGLAPDLGPPLNALGSLRNRFAHDLTAEIGKSEVDNLYQVFSGEQKKIAQDSFERVRKGAKVPLSTLEPMDRLRLLIVTLRQAVRVARMASLELRESRAQAPS